MMTPTTTLSAPSVSAVAPSSRVAAWLPAGMLDWPGRVAATLFLTGCQLRCPYCHNGALVAPKDTPDTWNEFTSYVNHRRAWIDGVVITGGEPTTDPGLESMLEAFASMGLPVKLDTNGMEPALLSRLIKRGLVSYVALDVKTLPERYHTLTSLPDAAERIRSSISILKRGTVDHEFRTTCYPGLIPLSFLPQIAGLLRGGDLYALQQFRPGETLHPEAARREPHNPAMLTQMAAQCSGLIPTVTRGV